MRQRVEPFTGCTGTVCNGKPGPQDAQYKHFCQKCGQRMRSIDYNSMHNLYDEMKSTGIPMGGPGRAE